MSQLQQFRYLFPSLGYQLHKGEMGKLGVIGGSFAYTGAPYFAAMTAMKMGVDLATVFCSIEAAIPIKSYSPDLMVRPVLYPSTAIDTAKQHLQCEGHQVQSRIVSSVLQWLQRLECIIIGPGLGRDDMLINSTCIEILQSISKSPNSSDSPLPIIVDGDGINLFIQMKDYHTKYKSSSLIFTPNAMEFRRLWQTFISNTNAPDFDVAFEEDAHARHDADPAGIILPLSHPAVKDTSTLATALGHATILRKGRYDVISDGHHAILVQHGGSPRRVGGQGDVLSGAVGTFITWALQARNGSSTVPQHLAPLSPTLQACYAAAVLCRELQGRAFALQGRAMLASHLVSLIPEVVQEIMPVDGVDIPPFMPKL